MRNRSLCNFHKRAGVAFVHSYKMHRIYLFFVDEGSKDIYNLSRNFIPKLLERKKRK